ncbi:MAG TPA: hypothetical protein VKA35_06600 [Solirubrobacterales bacterium]|nr:hypothetical protein [Solirubrobacterales bacterium]
MGASMIRRIGPEEYEELCRTVGTAVAEATPPQSVVAVVSKGDPKLTDLQDRSGLHFPSDADGRYAGFHPRTSEEAIAQVDTARAAGAEYLCIPQTAFWWLEHYQGFANWLGAHCRSVGNRPDACLIYELLRSPAPATQPGAEGQLRSLLDALLPGQALLFTIGFSSENLSAPGRTVTPLSRSSAFGLRRRLSDVPEQPAFVLVSRREGEEPMEAALERSLYAIATPVARRESLCDLLQVKSLDSGSRISRSPRVGDEPSEPPSPLDGEAADKLSKRLERLGLPGDNGVSRHRPARERE